jgi:hypothetical protein
MEYLCLFCKAHKISFAYIKKIILRYQYFDFKKGGYFMLVNLNPVRKRTKKNIEINTSDAKQSEK